MAKKAETKKDKKVEVVFIMDRSGSMSGLEDDTIGGFNSMLKEQKEDGGEVTWSTVLFDTRHEVIHNRVPIEKVEPLTEKEYYTRGCTALLDAVGRAINHIGMCHRYAKAEDVPDNTIFVITTDGYENSSREYSYEKVKKMIELEKEKFGWEFIFLGANIDAVSEAARIGIGSGRAATYINDGEGITKNFTTAGRAIMEMKCKSALDEDCLEEVWADYEARGGRGRGRKR